MILICDCLSNCIQRYNIFMKTENRENTARYRDGKDRFMMAWMMIKIMEEHQVNFLNRKRLARDLEESFAMLGIGSEDDCLKQEWADFARSWIASCLNSGTYGSVVFGVAQVSEKNRAMRIAHDIDLVTRIIPARFQKEKAAEPFRRVMIDAYVEQFSQGYWDDYSASI